MKKCFFRVIVPNYNGEKYIENCLNSILNQSFKSFEVIVVDDCSTDNSLEIIKKIAERDKRITVLNLMNKKYSGGSRNVGMQYPMNSKYTLFIDNDDCFVDNDCFETIRQLIEENKYPDCIRLSYNWCGEEFREVILTESTPEELVKDCNVACWTKCIKSELMVKFPENTLMEDVVQHIAQCDVLDTVIPCVKPIINWNRSNPNSTSTNWELQNCKWYSSMYRYCADLMDLKVNKPYCEARRMQKLERTINNIKSGVVEQ